jgi:hypothetical protein
MDNTKITFEVSPTNPQAKLGFETWLDDQLVFDTEHLEKPTEICVPVSDNEAEHELRFVLKNKLPEHTRISATGEIESDAVLKISNIAFDGIALGHVITEHAVYTHDFNVGQWVCLEKEPFFENMGCNGIVSLKFTTPIYIWLLENM